MSNKNRILVVDDEASIRHIVRTYLESSGFEVTCIDNGPDALTVFARFEPSLVLLDIGMPEMDGYEVARRIRARTGPKQPVLVALTGWGQEKDRQQVRDAGFDHHLVKPADLRALQSLLLSLDEARQAS